MAFLHCGGQNPPGGTRMTRLPALGIGGAGVVMRRRERRWTATPAARDVFTRWLDQWRQRVNLSHEAFARQVLGVTPPVWSRVYNGRRPISQAMLNRVLEQRPSALRIYLQALKQRQV